MGDGVAQTHCDGMAAWPECHPEHGVQLGREVLDLELLDVSATEAFMLVVEQSTPLGKERGLGDAGVAVALKPTGEMDDVRHDGASVG